MNEIPLSTRTMMPQWHNKVHELMARICLAEPRMYADEARNLISLSGFVIIQRGLITEAIEQCGRTSADPYEDISNAELANRLRTSL